MCVCIYALGICAHVFMYTKNNHKSGVLCKQCSATSCYVSSIYMYKYMFSTKNTSLYTYTI